MADPPVTELDDNAGRSTVLRASLRAKAAWSLSQTPDSNGRQPNTDVFDRPTPTGDAA